MRSQLRPWLDASSILNIGIGANFPYGGARSLQALSLGNLATPATLAFPSYKAEGADQQDGSKWN